MPMTCTLPEFCFASSSSFGNDCLQGPHHVAQKSTTAILPESDSSVIEPFPLTVSTFRSGAALPTSAGPALPSPSVLGVIGGFLLPPPQAEVAARTKEIPTTALALNHAMRQTSGRHVREPLASVASNARSCPQLRL